MNNDTDNTTTQSAKATFKLYSEIANVKIDGLTKIDQIKRGEFYALYFEGPAHFNVRALEAKGLYLKRL